MQKKVSMIDIINERKEKSDLCWILKDYESKIAFFNNYKSKELLKQQIFDSLEFKYDLKLLADKTAKSVDELLKESVNILEGMGHNIGMNSIRLMGYILSKIIKQIFKHVYVNIDQIEKIREAFKSGNVILLPTHRSYADFLLMSYVMFYFNLPMPVIAAAMDFMNMKVIGELLRACGAFFIKRSFANDDLYWTVFSHYIKSLIKGGQEPLEFYIEGTRSRTNKSLSPKIGLLGIVLELWLARYGDIRVVPIGISYDRVLENKLYAWELLGQPKPRESTSGLFKVRHILDENYGNIYFNIADPISISQLAAKFDVTRLSHNLQLRCKPSLFDNEKHFLRHFAKLIVESQQQCLVVCDWAIVVLILLNNGLYHYQMTSFIELVHMYDAMIKLLCNIDVTLATNCGKVVESSDKAVNTALDLHSHVVMKFDDKVDLVGCQCALYTDMTSQMRIDDLMVGRIELGCCRNPLLFHLSRESILLSLLSYGGHNNDHCAISKDFFRVFGLLNREFIFSGSHQSNLDSTIKRLCDSDLINIEWEPNYNNICYDIIQSAVQLHIVAYVVYGHIFLTNDTKPCNPVELCKFVQKSVIAMLMSSASFAHVYLEICSLDLIRNCICRFNEILKCQSVLDIRVGLGSLENCLPATVRMQLTTICR